MGRVVVCQFTINNDNPVQWGGIRHLPVMENEYRSVSLALTYCGQLATPHIVNVVCSPR